jgi:hypothetical protein
MLFTERELGRNNFGTISEPSAGDMTGLGRPANSFQRPVTSLLLRQTEPPAKPLVAEGVAANGLHVARDRARDGRGGVAGGDERADLLTLRIGEQVRASGGHGLRSIEVQRASLAK